MPPVTKLTGRILLGDTLTPARLTFHDGRIAAIEPAADNGPLILPGFVDLHCHGGGGADVMDGGDAVARMAALHARNGTTTLLATTLTAPIEEIETALAAVQAAMLTARPGSADVAGVHLEGPFISPDRLGAQPNFPLSADLDVMDRFLNLAPIRVITLAPEADPEARLARHLRSRGVRVQIGHTSCGYEVGARWIGAELDGVTHLFNAMTGLQHRAPGLAGAALAHARHAELIADLLHVEPGAVLVALKAVPELYAVTDGTAASGMPDGSYHLGRQKVERRGRMVCMSDGALAGSCLTMIEAFGNLVSLGLSIPDASRRTATIAADYLGLVDRGRIEVGRRADLVVLDDVLAIQQVLVAGVVAA